MTGPQPLYRHLGRVIVGLGLMVLALNLTVSASEQLRLSSGLETLLSALSEEVVVAVLIGAGLAWLFHSSVALVLLVVGFAAGGVVSPAMAFPLVWGPTSARGSFPQYLHFEAGERPVAYHWATCYSGWQPSLLCCLCSAT